MATIAPVQATAAHNLSKSARAEAEGLQAPTYEIPRGDVRLPLSFFTPPADGSEPFNVIKPRGPNDRNYGDVPVDVSIHDIRGHESDFTLDKDAFAAIQNVPESAEHGFVDDDSIRANYYPEVEQLLLDHVPGSKRVVIFDHTIRRSTPDADRAPVMLVHIDQTAKSAAMRVQHHLPDEAATLLAGRYRIINVWRPLNGPVASSPLAFASSASVSNDDVVPVQHRYPDRTGETAGVKHHPDQRWNYWSGMTNNERLLLECFDSEALKEGSAVQGGRVPHTAFKDPRSAANAPGRESIEVRTLVFSD